MMHPADFDRALGRAWRSALALLTLAAVAIAQPTQPFNGPRHATPQRHALVHATLIPEPGVLIENATIVIDGGVIRSVEAGRPAPPGHRVWDCTGLHVYAGLIEPYAEVEAAAPDAASPGVHWNPKVLAQRSALDGEGLSGGAKKKLRGMGYAVAHIAPDDGVFRGRSAIVSLGDEDNPADPLAGVIREQQAHVVAMSGRGGGYPSSKMGVIALIRQTLADVPWRIAAAAAHERGLEGAERPAPDDAVDTLADDLPLLFSVGDELDLLRAGKIAREFDRSWMVLGSGTEYRRLETVVAERGPIILPLPMPEAPSLATPGDRHDVSLRELMAWEQAPTNPRRLRDAGALVALTTAKLPEKQSFTKNLRKAIEHGLSEDDALAMLTTEPAEVLGLEARFGRVEPGFAANLVVVADGGLFDEDREIRDVWIDGDRYEINAAPELDLDGEWAVMLGAPIDATGTLTVKDGKKLTLTIDRPADDAAAEAGEGEGEGEATPDDAPAPAKVKTKNVQISENRIGFIAIGEALGRDGAVMLAAVVEGDRLVGEGETPEGEAFDWLGGRLDPEDEDAGDAGADAPEDAAQDGDADDDETDAGAVAADVPDVAAMPFGAFGYEAVPEQTDLLITGATIWTSGPAGILEDASMLIEDGEVAWVREGRARAARGVRVIDARGKHITPGLIDCHSHTGISGGVNEGTQACTSEVRIFDVINPDDVNWYRQLAGGITLVNQLHGSANPIGGQNSVVKLRWGCAHPDDMRMHGAPSGIKFALGENVKQSNWSNAPRTRYPQTRMGVETFIRDRFTAAAEYAAAESRLGTLFRRDLELEALAEILAGERLVHCHSYRQDEILMLCRIAAEFGFTIGTFQHILEGYKVADEVKEHALGGSAFSDWWAYKYEVVDAIPYAGAIMHDVGVVVSFNSDSNELARRMNVEAAKAVKYGGVAPEEALKFVTLNPAIQLGIEDRVGSLEPGKDADFVIWSGDPLSSMSRCEATYIDGRDYFSLARDADRREAAAAERRRLIQKVLTDGEAAAKDDDDDRRGEAPDEGRDLTDSPPPTYLESLTSGGRMLIIPPGAGGDLAELRESMQARELEAHFNWLITNGLDPFATRPGDCGCEIHNRFGIR